MSGERYVVVGLAQVRSAWFRELARWATTAAVPLDFVKCVSIDELRARLTSGRAFSAVVADAGLVGIDRDLVEAAHEIGCAVILVDDGAARRSFDGLGVAAVLPHGFDRSALLGALHEHASPVGVGSIPSSAVPRTSPELAATPPTWRGRLVAVTGPAGTGTSITAMALAAGLAADVRAQGRVLLADLALDADQAMLHDARDIVPGVQELVEAFRHGDVPPAEVLALTFGDGHPYRLLLGLRRHADWTALRPRAWSAALEGLRRTFTHVVADVDPDVEGEVETGSMDVEDRNLLARSVLGSADVVVVTATGGAHGVHRLVRVLGRLLDHGIEADRLLPVIHRAPRSARARAELASAVSVLLVGAAPAGAPVCTPLFLPGPRNFDAAIHDGVGPPASMGTALVAAVDAVGARSALGSAGAAGAGGDPVEAVPERIVPGSLGSWATSQEAAG